MKCDMWHVQQISIYDQIVGFINGGRKKMSEIQFRILAFNFFEFRSLRISNNISNCISIAF